jgi:hypothetical protein
MEMFNPAEHLVEEVGHSLMIQVHVYHLIMVNSRLFEAVCGSGSNSICWIRIQSKSRSGV